MIDAQAVCIEIPAGFRVEDILAFHRRDTQEIAERVRDGVLEKALVWQGAAACLTIRFDAGLAQAHAVLETEGRENCAQQCGFETMVRRMLGLTQDVVAFEAHYGSHPQIGPLITRQAGLRVPAAATPFEALTWAITGQQISVHAAVALRRRLIQTTGVVNADGMCCYPSAAQVIELTEPQLRAAGFSQSKARTLLALAQGVVEGRLPLDDWAIRMPDVESVSRQLQEVRGIGPWTVNYALLRGFGWLDGSLHGDVAVRRSLQGLLGRSEAVGEAETREWLKPFSPWRALVAAHLWARQSTVAM